MNTLLVAHDYIQKGWSVFPLAPRQKIPACAGGFLASSLDVDVVDKLWANRIDCNIGIATGERSGLFVLDIDGPAGEESLKALQEKYGSLPATRISYTGKGRHILFQMPHTPIRNSAGKLGKGLDIRANGGYIVAPPSIHPNGSIYQWSGDDPVSDAPEWLIKLLTQQTEQQPYLPSTGPEFSREDILDMLSYLHPDDNYDQWVNVGMALHHAGCGLEMWDGWSRRGAKYKNDCRTHWKSFHADGSITLGTLVYLAEKAGWSYTPQEIVGKEHPAQAFLDKLAVATKPLAYHIDTSHLAPTIQKIVDLIIKKSVRPQPLIALVNTLTFFGALYGRRYQSPTGLRSNIYTISIAPSTLGKDQSRKTLFDIMSQVPGMQDMNGGDTIVSTAGLITLLAKAPRRLVMLDEMGMYLQAVGHEHASGHERQIVSLLMQLFSKAQSTWTGAQYADADKEQITIANPHLCIYGTSTMQAYANAMTADAIENGSMNRFIIFPGDDTPPIHKRPDINPLPNELLKELEALQSKVKSICGNLADVMDSKVVKIVPHTVFITEEADDYYWKLFEEQDKKRLGQANNLGPLWGRFSEHAMKIAMVNAITRQPEDPTINIQDMRLGEDVARMAVLFSIKVASEHMNSGEFDKRCKAILAYIHKASVQGVSKSKLTLFARSLNMNAKEVDNALLTLCNEGSIKALAEDASKPGPKATMYYINVT